MAAGDIVNPNRPAFYANERLDTVDADALSDSLLLFVDAFARAVSATPLNLGGVDGGSGRARPTGLIVQGFGLTLNPTSPSDNKVRITSPAGVAFDANGRLLIKAAGVTVDLTLPSGNSQIYAYYIDDLTNTATRRFISVAPPYTESPSAVATSKTGDVAYWVRAGDGTSIVATDVVNGKTTALCFLGVVTNTAGAITCSGYNSVTAPNGDLGYNRLTSILATSPLPTMPTSNLNGGGVATMLDFVKAIAYVLGNGLWATSRLLTPTIANNYGAFQAPAIGLQRIGEDVYQVRYYDIDLSGAFLIANVGPYLKGVGSTAPSWNWATPFFGSPGDTLVDLQVTVDAGAGNIQAKLYKCSPLQTAPGITYSFTTTGALTLTWGVAAPATNGGFYEESNFVSGLDSLAYPDVTTGYLAWQIEFNGTAASCGIIRVRYGVRGAGLL